MMSKARFMKIKNFQTEKVAYRWVMDEKRRREKISLSSQYGKVSNLIRALNEEYIDEHGRVNH